MGRALARAAALLLGVVTSAIPVTALAEDDVRDGRLYLIGQDLDAIRGYVASDCCPRPDGGTAYLDFYKLLDPASNFGGLGVDAALVPVDSEKGWGAGPVSAWKTAQEAGGTYLAIGLDLTGEPERGAFAQIAKGRFDTEIDHLAAFLKATDKIVLLRIGYEFDGVWNAPYADTNAYVAVWHHIVDRIRASGNAKVAFVWQGASSPIDDVLEGRHEDIAQWYPGDAYVDWVGTSWFLPPDDEVNGRGGGKHNGATTQRELTDEIVAFARERRKPVMIAELSPQGFDLARRTRRNISSVWDGPAGEHARAMTDAEIWRSWYQPLVDYLSANDDVVQAIAYINVNWDAQPMWGAPYASGYWGDSRLEMNSETAAQWSQAITAWQGGAVKAE